jgi:Mg2+-importing ATPase
MKVFEAISRRIDAFRSGSAPRADAQAGAAPQSDAELRQFAALSGDETLAALGSSAQGLHDREALKRLEKYGPNAVVHEKRLGFTRQLWERLFTPLNLLLLALAGVSYAMDDLKAAIVISMMVVLSALLSAIQESRSTAAAEKLHALVKTTATVLRIGRRRGNSAAAPPDYIKPAHLNGKAGHEIPIERLVPGDIVHISAGDMIPADVRILAAKDLFVNQASLTGESLPVEKFDHIAQETNTMELGNLCFMGSNVVSGTATAVIVRTGRKTFFGALAGNLTAPRAETSFEKGVSRFTLLMIRFMLVMVPLVFLANGITKGDWLEAFVFGVAIAVGLAPEMLPMVVTINLAKGAIEMSRKKTIVKRLNAIQNFGAMDVLCTDKTGTLTQDRVILKRHLDIAGRESAYVLDMAYLNSFFQSGLRNLLDVAVLAHGEVHERLGIESNYRQVDEVPFDFSRRRMSVVLEKPGEGHLLVCKGAVEEVFNACVSYQDATGAIMPIDANHLDQLHKVTNDLNEDGFRVISIAYKRLIKGKSSYGVADETGLVLLGYIAFLDPPKESAHAAIAALGQYGVAVKILTGDNAIVTRKVCFDVGLPVGRVVLGSEIDRMGDSELQDIAERETVFAKLAPMQKARIVQALHAKGHIVGFLGDGINDGPALKAADVGISVDGAIDIAKESADIILLEKNLLVLKEGVVEGRRVFGNVTKYIRMGASSNFGNMFSVLGGSLFLPFLPMAPIQVLLNNLLYDFSQTAIATDEVDKEYLEKPRKWEIGDIARFMVVVGPVSSIFDYTTFFTLLYAFDAWDKPALFHTGWFVESLLSQTLIVHIIRTGRIPFLQSRASLPLMITTIFICSVGAWLPYSRFADALGFTALPPGYWAVLVLILFSYLLVMQLVKSWLIRRFGLH